MQKITLTHRNKIIDRYNESFSELPDTIKKSTIVDKNGWQVFFCSSANNNCMIATKYGINGLEAIKY